MSLYGELNQRKVFRVAAAYIVIGWLVLQVSGMLFEHFGAPAWIGNSITAALVLGFVPSVALAWIFDAGRAAAPPSGRLEAITITAMVLAVILTAWERMVPSAVAPVQTSAVTADAAAKPEPVIPPLPELEITPGSIAVLPFENRSTVEGTQYFVDGVHDDLLAQLARFSALKVISRTSVMEYRSTTKPLEQIGRELGVATILEAAVQRAGERVRITTQLIDAKSGKHLWGDSYDRELSTANVFDIQTEIARAIAKQLISALSPEQIKVLEVAPHTTDQAAYDLYLQARATGAESIDGDILKRLALYKRAVEIDPKFALAIGEVGIEYTNHYWFATRDPADRDEGRRWIDRALALAPEEPRLQWLLAQHLYHGHLDYDGALAVLDRAEKGMPNGAEIFELRSWILRRQGSFAASIEANERAIRLDPRNPFAIIEHLDTYSALGDMVNLKRWVARLDALPPLGDLVRLLEVLSPQFMLDGNTAPLSALLAKIPPGSQEAALMELELSLPYLERRYEAALVAVEAVGADPVMTQAKILTRSLQRALVYNAQGDETKTRAQATAALQQLDDFLKKLPDDPRAVAARAQALALLGRADDARAEALRALDLYPMTRDRLSAPSFMATRLRTLALIADSNELANEMSQYLALPAQIERIDYLWLDPVFDRHRKDVAIMALVERYSLKGS